MFTYFKCHYPQHSDFLLSLSYVFFFWWGLLQAVQYREDSAQTEESKEDFLFAITSHEVNISLNTPTTGGSQRRAWPGDTGHCPGPTSQWRSAGPPAPGCPSPPPVSWLSWPLGWGHRPHSLSAASGQSWGPCTDHWCTHCRYLKWITSKVFWEFNQVYFLQDWPFSVLFHKKGHSYWFLFQENCENFSGIPVGIWSQDKIIMRDVWQMTQF